MENKQQLNTKRKATGTMAAPSQHPRVEHYSSADWKVKICRAGGGWDVYHVPKYLSSAYFAAFLQNGKSSSCYGGAADDGDDKQEEETVKIDLDDLAADVFPHLLDYLYSNKDGGGFQAAVEVAVPLYFLARCLQVRSLLDYLVHFIDDRLYNDEDPLCVKTFYDHAAALGLEPILRAVETYFMDKLLTRTWKMDGCDYSAPCLNLLLAVLEDDEFLLNLNADQSASLRMSCVVANSLEKHGPQVSVEDFLVLTNRKALPKIEHNAAIMLVAFEETIGASPQGEWSCLKERCFRAQQVGNHDLEL
jgi:hypothetical protein